MDALFQLSLVAAFVAGMVALFAPCCITFLLPTYLANVFKEKKRVVLMTFIYSLGIFTIMLPVVLGAKALSSFFFERHDQVYIIGGVFLILMAFASLLGFKLPMPNFKTTRQADDPVSTYILGVMSGITSACCAPVLVGVMALSALSAGMLQSLAVGFLYVLGMVTPLYVAGLLIDKRNILEKPLLRKPFREVEFGGKTRTITVANLVSFILFTVIGLATIFLTLSGRLSMGQTEEDVAKRIQAVALEISQMVQGIPGLDWAFLVVVGFLLYKFFKYIRLKDR